MVLLKPNPRERITWNALVSHPFVDRTDLVALDIPHPPSIQEETESEFSPASSPIKSTRSTAAADASAADFGVPSSVIDASDAAHFAVSRSAPIAAHSQASPHSNFTQNSISSQENPGIPKVPSSESLGHVNVYGPLFICVEMM
jgi:hypothetical protein